MIGADPPDNSISPRPDGEMVLKEYETGRLNQIYRNRKHIRAQMILLVRVYLLFGGRGLLHTDPHLTAARYYHYLGEGRRDRHVRDAIARIEDFREWHSKHYPTGSPINPAYRGGLSVSGKPDTIDNQKQRSERDAQTREERGDD